MNWLWLVLFFLTAGVGYYFWKKPPTISDKPPAAMEQIQRAEPADLTPGLEQIDKPSSGPLGDSAKPRVDSPAFQQNPQIPPPGDIGQRPAYPQNPMVAPPPPNDMFNAGQSDPNDYMLPPPGGMGNGQSPPPITPEDPMYDPMPNVPQNNFEGQDMAPPPPVYEPPANDDSGSYDPMDAGGSDGAD